MSSKIIHVSDAPDLDQVPENATFPIHPCALLEGGLENDDCRNKNLASFQLPKKFVVMGHRGSGMNLLQSPDSRMKSIRENSMRAFDAARTHDLDFIEFDVQVTRDGCPIVFHDISILTEEKDTMIEKRVTDLSLNEFLSYGPQTEPEKVGKPLFRKLKDGRIFDWKVEKEDHLCTLQQVLQEVDSSLGFNIELKFDNDFTYKQEQLVHALEIIVQMVHEHAKDRPIIFSSFQPDAILLIRKLQNTYPVFFLTNGGSEIYPDVRRNSLDEALKLCLEGGLQGIVSEVKAILRNPGSIKKIKESNLSLLTYGQLNNVPEVVQMQYLLDVEGVIVDLVKEITEIVGKFCQHANKNAIENQELLEGAMAVNKTHCSNDEISLFLRLIPELVNA